MQIQTQVAGGIRPASALVDGAVRRNSGASSSAPGSVEALPAGMQKDAVAARGGKEDVDKAVEKINKAVQAFSQKLEFSVDRESEAFVVKVVDKDTREVIRQIPSEEMLQIARALDKLQGLLIEDEA